MNIHTLTTVWRSYTLYARRIWTAALGGGGAKVKFKGLAHTPHFGPT